ncbi:MAG: hypothetical protein V5A81_01245 [Candidatus Bipolaricaulota bacterium]|nr:hypothetical protein [Candidatus Bipolaricaulota bacterium]MBS3792192.1 hypothetical protein [Candidatus Bipolaricaulota bacterium]
MDSVRVTRGDFAKADSLSDFDLVFIDPDGIDRLWTAHLRPQSDGKFRTNPKEDGGLANGLRNLMRARREELINLLERAGGAIFCKLRKPGRELTVLTKDEEKEFNRYTWLPETERELFRGGRAIETRKGKRLSPREISSPVVKFINDFRESISYESVLKNQSLTEVQRSEVFASTPIGDVVSFGFVRGEGSLVFLPAGMELKSSGEQELVKAAEKVVRGGGYYSPSWLDNYCLPSEKDIRNELKELDREISRLKKQREEKTEDLRDIDDLKGLLTSRTNHELKSSLSRALEVAGFDVEEDSSGIDLMISDTGEVNLAITVGVNPEAPVDLDPYHRLVQGINELKIFENKDPQGVVVVNGFGTKDPADRESQAEEELLEGCGLYGFTVLTAEEIFERIKEIKKGKVGSREGLIELFQNG